MNLIFSLLLGASARPECFDPVARTLFARARGARGLRQVFAELSDPFTGVTPEHFAALAMSDHFTIDGRPLRASEAFRLATGGVAILPDGEVNAHQMQIFARLAPLVRDFADLVALARAPGREGFVRTLVSGALVSARISGGRGDWALSPHDWATILDFWWPERVDPRECARVVDLFANARDLRVALTHVTRADLREGVMRAAARRRCRTYLWRGGQITRFP